MDKEERSVTNKESKMISARGKQIGKRRKKGALLSQWPLGV